MKLEDNMIIITTNNYKTKILKENKLKYNIKIYTLNEFKEKYYYQYKPDILMYMKNKYNMIPEIASVILENLYDIENKKYESAKLNNLVNIKNDLIDNGYIIYNHNFKKFIEDKKIICYNTKFKNYEVIMDNIEPKKEIIIYKYESIIDEVICTAMKIKKLIEDGVDINNIKINSLDGSYTGIFNRIFTFYNIPYDLPNDKLYFLSDIKKFLNETPKNTKLLDLNDELEKLNLNESIHNELVNIINKYTNYETLGDIYDVLIYELKQKSVKLKKYTDIITEINYKNYIPNDNEYIFMLGFNQDIIPKIYKDDSYLLDKERKELNIELSKDKNEEEVRTLTNFINMTKNLILSYKLSSPKQEFGYSNYLTSLNNLKETTCEYDYKNEKINKLLLAERLDNFILYNDKANDLTTLYSNYKNLEYSTYSNLYEKIDYDIIKKQINNKINLSFSNINTFYKCSFRFLLDNIYRVSTFETSVSQIIGNLFHRVLEKTYSQNRNDYDTIIDEAILEFYPNGLTKKEQFYSEKYRKAIKDLIEILNENYERTKFENTYFEQSFKIKVENDIDISLKGFVDKILTLNDGESTYVIVIDYKTGGMHNDFKKVVHGLDMQLLMYLYLIKNSGLIKNPKFAGMYLQQIMTEVLNKDPKKTYHQQIVDNVKLNGYTLKDTKVAGLIDSKFEESSYIKSLKLKKDGDFMSSSKVLTEEEINEFIDIVEDNINKAILSINNCDFDINPKKIGKVNEGCLYCKYQDICYVNNDNIIELEIGGDEDVSESES